VTLFGRNAEINRLAHYLRSKRTDIAPWSDI